MWEVEDMTRSGGPFGGVTSNVVSMAARAWFKKGFMPVESLQQEYKSRRAELVGYQSVPAVQKLGLVVLRHLAPWLHAFSAVVTWS